MLYEVITDKTGTLTRSEMTVQAVVTAERCFRIGGVGYDPHGGIQTGGEEVTARNNFV